MKIMNTVKLVDNLYGRGLSALLDDKPESKATTETENEIKKKIKSLKDERNTHNQRIAAIDAEVSKLEAELSIIAEQNKADKITDLENEYSQHEQRMASIKSQLEQLKATPVTT